MVEKEGMIASGVFIEPEGTGVPEGKRSRRGIRQAR